MTVTLSVHDVREHIRRASEPSATSAIQTSSPLLGRIFHEVAADLAGCNSVKNAFSFLETLDFDKEVWRSRLAPRVYDLLLGPRLAKDQARLQEISSGVLHLWEAVQALCEWFVGLAWAARNPDGRKRALSWEQLRKALQAEVPLEAEFNSPDWSEPVRLTGIADSLLRLPRAGTWCIQEYKLGRASYEADLCQICLYHLILTQKKPRRKNTPRCDLSRMLALITFQPDMKERLFSEDEIFSAQEKLLTLIGSLAGVTSKVSTPAPRPKEKPSQTARTLGRKMIEVFTEYGRPVELTGDPVTGPAFFRFPVSPGRGIKLDQLQRLAREIQVRLGLSRPPFIGVDSGRAVVDVERKDRQIIQFADVQDQLPAGDPLTGSAFVPLGMDLDAKLRVADLNNPLNAHLLVAGTTGSGKTEWLRVAIQGLIHSNTPQTLRLVLIDPKRTAFNEFADSPYLMTPESLVFPDGRPVGNVLKELVQEMERRYVSFQKAGVDNVDQFTGSTRQVLPRIVCVCDEYYALIVGDSKKRKEIEMQVSLLGAKARAAGIHLILATQQPSREVIKGTLDSNIPARVGLMMVKREESKMLLGQAGAENLLGKGDLLFRDVGDPIRLQAPLW
jgi:energy-coupling factor transporter ATP-binding protein EcfA2